MKLLNKCFSFWPVCPCFCSVPAARRQQFAQVVSELGGGPSGCFWLFWGSRSYKVHRGGEEGIQWFSGWRWRPPAGKKNPTYQSTLCSSGNKSWAISVWRTSPRVRKSCARRALLHLLPAAECLYWGWWVRRRCGGATSNPLGGILTRSPGSSSRWMESSPALPVWGSVCGGGLLWKPY